MTTTQLLVVLGASFAGALVKAVTGMGYPLVAVPLISLVLGVEDAVVLVALPNLAANAYLNYESRDARPDTRDLGVLTGVGVVGAVVGTVLLVHLDEEPLMLALAGVVLVFVFVFIRHPEMTLSERASRRGAPIVGGLAGLAQGAVGISGPVVATWIHGYRLSPRAFVHSVTLIFGVTGLAQIVVLLAQRQFDQDRLVAALVAGSAVVAATALGLALRRRLAGSTFDRVVIGVLVVSALALVVEAVF